MTFNIPPHLTGLSSEEVLTSQKKNGFNKINADQKGSWITLLLDILKEPMLLLLIAVAIIYLIVGDYGEAIFMFGAIVAVSGISFSLSLSASSSTAFALIRFFLISDVDSLLDTIGTDIAINDDKATNVGFFVISLSSLTTNYQSAYNISVLTENYTFTILYFT